MISPLDWGLGHATRCLPIISYLQQEGHQVTVAASKNMAGFIQQCCPDVKILPLHGYGIRYSRREKRFTAKILAQVPKILYAIRKEHRWLQRIQKIHAFDCIISDNRYGLYHPSVPCAIMTHQLHIQSGKGHRTDTILQKIHYRLLRRFDACWVVDAPGKENLAGKLSHPPHIPPHAQYIGLLSQMTLLNRQGIPSSSPAFLQTQKKKILILLSGPEPMREALADELKEQCLRLATTFEIIFVTGKKGTTNGRELQKTGIQYADRLTAMQLLPLLQAADLVICRSGYSTLMDLACVGKRALLIPTPGQTEQEYLALYLSQKFHTATARQGAVALSEAIPQALSGHPVQMPPEYINCFHQAVKELLMPQQDA